MLQQILASFDDEGIFVYQAFKGAIADEALRLGTFGKGFSLERMTWIKPGYLTEHDMRGNSVARIPRIAAEKKAIAPVMSVE